MTPESRNIRHFGYRAADRVLAVQFKGGDIYEYDDVPVEEFDGMRHADSAGSYLAKNITPRYQARKLT